MLMTEKHFTFHQMKNQKLPVLLRKEPVLIMETACYSINDIPYANDKEALYISPNDILVPSYHLSSLASAENLLGNVNILIQKIRVYHEKINKILQETFLSERRRLRPGQLRVTKSKNDVVPSEGDLVLI